MTDSEPPSSNTPKGPLAVLAVIVILVAGGLWLEHRMHAQSIMEDCLLAGRKNCAPLQ